MDVDNQSSATQPIAASETESQAGLQPSTSSADSTATIAPPAATTTAPIATTAAPATATTTTSDDSSPPSYGSAVRQPIAVRPPPPQQPPPIDSATGRVLVTVEKPFVYGTAAFWLGKPPGEGSHSHRWSVFVRGLENEDLSYFISSVTFHLHSSFTQPNRQITTAPFELTETGWGEFIINITVEFIDSSLPPIHFSHLLKLFPPPTIPPSLQEPVMSETYDEFVFHQPYPAFYQTLIAGPTHRLVDHPFSAYWTTKQFAREENAAIVKLAAAVQQCRERTILQRHSLYKIEQDIQQLTTRIP